MKILVTGSTGLVGTSLVRALAYDGHTVVRLARADSSERRRGAASATARWDQQAATFGPEAAGADAAINLAGESIAGGRWTNDRKQKIRSSRVDLTRMLVVALNRLNPKPKVLVSASAIGYYGDRGEEGLTEASEPGAGFLPDVARDWESEARKAQAIGMRVVTPRFGVILAKNGGALPQMARPFQFGVGGKIGSGRQWQSWITLEDVVQILRLALTRDDVHGPINTVAPEPVRNEVFAKKLGRALRRPSIFPTPAFALRLALGRELADALLLASQRVVPRRLEELGYQFLHPELGEALDSIYRSK